MITKTPVERAKQVVKNACSDLEEKDADPVRAARMLAVLKAQTADDEDPRVEESNHA